MALIFNCKPNRAGRTGKYCENSGAVHKSWKSARWEGSWATYPIGWYCDSCKNEMTRIERRILEPLNEAA